MKRDLLVFPLPVSQAQRSSVALVSAWRVTYIGKWEDFLAKAGLAMRRSCVSFC